MAKVISTEKEIGSVKMKYSENRMQLHEQMASGTIDGVKYTVNNAWGSVYVEFSNLKGSIPKIGIDMADLVREAYKEARNNNLIETKRPKKVM